MHRLLEQNSRVLQALASGPEPVSLPARSAFGANGLALGGEVEIECVAYWPRER